MTQKQWVLCVERVYSLSERENNVLIDWNGLSSNLVLRVSMNLGQNSTVVYAEWYFDQISAAETYIAHSAIVLYSEFCPSFLVITHGATSVWMHMTHECKREKCSKIGKKLQESWGMSTPYSPYSIIIVSWFYSSMKCESRSFSLHCYPFTLYITMNIEIFLPFSWLSEGNGSDTGNWLIFTQFEVIICINEMA